MPYRLDTHVLTVDANVIHKVDTGNPANLHSMWTVFSRCADSVDQGRRLENLSWRLWNRETFVVDNDDTDSYCNNKTFPQNIVDSQPQEIPRLSGSVDSFVDEEAVDFTCISTPLEISRPRIRRQDSCTSSRSRRSGHISSDDFEKLIVSIVKDKEPLSAPRIAPIAGHKKEVSPSPPPLMQRSGSTSTDSESATSPRSPDAPSEVSVASREMTSRATTVVRGFAPSPVPVARTISCSPQSTPADAIPEPTSQPAAKLVQSKKQPARFALGGSCSSSEQDQSPETRQPPKKTIAAMKKPVFQIGGSSEDDGSLKSALASPRPANALGHKKKQASFSSNVMTHTIDDEAAVDSDTDYIDESAIDDDDDSSDWEDSVEDSGKSSMEENLFQRVDSKPNLTSRPSLITLMLAQTEQRARALGNHASQSTSALPRSRLAHNGPSLGASPNDSDEAPLMMRGMRGQTTLRPIHEIPRSSAQPIVGGSSQAHHQAALSPRTTRRNMLATELTESLRRHLLWERQQKSSTANAVLKRRHTSHDVANLKQYPERSCIKAGEDANASSWNQYFSKETSNGYHSKGW